MTSSPGSNCDIEYNENTPLAKVKDAKICYEDSYLKPTCDGRYIHLDITRMGCICVVVVDHCLDCFPYSSWNVLFGQHWVLQFIFVVCGVSFGLSKNKLSGYVLRLCFFMFIGVLLNWVAFMIKGLDWRHDVWNVIFQFFFIVGVILYSFILAPVHTYFLWLVDGRETILAPFLPLARSIGMPIIVFGLIFNYLVMAMWLPPHFTTSLQNSVLPWLELRFGEGLNYRIMVGGKSDILQSFFAAIELSLSNIWLAVFVPLLLPSQRSITAWLILLNMTMRRLSDWYAGPGEKAFNGLDLMLLGLVCRHFGLKHKKTLGLYVLRYWFLWLGIAGLVWIPGTKGRMDLLQPTEWKYTWRNRLLDFSFMFCWLVAADRVFDKKIFTEDRMDFMNNYFLVMYLVHRAVHIVLPSPWNWLVLGALLAPFWYQSRHSRRSLSTDGTCSVDANGAC